MSKVNMQMQINKLLNTAKPAGSLRLGDSH